MNKIAVIVSAFICLFFYCSQAQSGAVKAGCFYNDSGPEYCIKAHTASNNVDGKLYFNNRYENYRSSTGWKWIPNRKSPDKPFTDRLSVVSSCIVASRLVSSSTHLLFILYAQLLI